MNPQDKRIIFKQSSCISSEQLLLYTKNKLTPEEKHLIELHLVDCDLCSEALEGFGLLAGTTVLDETMSQVRLLTKNKTVARASISFKWWLAAASLIFIIGGTLWIYHKNYQPKNNFAETEKPSTRQERKAAIPSAPIENGNINAEKDSQFIQITDASKQKLHLNIPGSEKSLVAQRLEKMDSDRVSVNSDERNYENQLTDKSAVEQEPAVNNIGSPVPVVISENTPGMKAASAMKMNDKSMNTEIRFIEGLKTMIPPDDKMFADSLLLTDKTGVEAKYENESVKKDDIKHASGEIHYEIYDVVLVDAIHCYKKQDYKNASDLFNQILNNRKEDQNALFYGALCYDELNQNNDAINFLKRILKNRNSSFFEEAKWHLALLYLEENNISEGRILLQAIIDNNGFYSERAREKLEEIK